MAADLMRNRRYVDGAYWCILPVAAGLSCDAALRKIECPDSCVEAYRRIGAGLREFVFYIADREDLLDEFNACVAQDRRYPITIKFYQDEEWSELRELIDDFKVAPPDGPRPP
jgi:hypothetical protein